MKRGRIRYATAGPSFRTKLVRFVDNHRRVRKKQVDSSPCNENKVGACPERGGKAAASPRRKNNVVVIGRPETLDDGWRWPRLRDREVGEKPVNIRLPAVALGDEGDLRVLGREVPTQRCCQRDRVFIRLL